MVQFDDNELERRIDEVLFYIWDPIGVSPIPQARCEYRSYVPKVIQLLEQSDDPIGISSYLQQIASARMGLLPNKAKCDEVAELLLDHKSAIREGLG